MLPDLAGHKLACQMPPAIGVLMHLPASLTWVIDGRWKDDGDGPLRGTVTAVPSGRPPTIPSVPMMMRHRPAGSLPLRAEVTTSDGYARFDS